ncbi:hypothetical protein OHJ16_06425 [Actinomyces israelii]|uniref:Uncharacterized protein n=1 Tax=Actinomyces israelii TaxID=1659 RepID=A0ABT4I7G5_9ACTO|nr:hypothetical protein [Actinomyces israelii]MCZ0857677.1 hypothetical protein [Actinomyces israelii]
MRPGRRRHLIGSGLSRKAVQAQAYWIQGRATGPAMKDDGATLAP